MDWIGGPGGGGYGKYGRGQKCTQCKGKFVPLPAIKAYKKWRLSPACLIFVEATHNQWVGGWVKPRAGLKVQENSLAPAGN